MAPGVLGPCRELAHLLLPFAGRRTPLPRTFPPLSSVPVQGRYAKKKVDCALAKVGDLHYTFSPSPFSRTSRLSLLLSRPSPAAIRRSAVSLPGRATSYLGRLQPKSTRGGLIRVRRRHGDRFPLAHVPINLQVGQLGFFATNDDDDYQHGDSNGRRHRIRGRVEEKQRRGDCGCGGGFAMLGCRPVWRSRFSLAWRRP